MRSTKARTNPARFRAMIGLYLESFDYILLYFKDAHDEYFRYHRLDGSRRSGKRRTCIYSNSPLPSVEERLYFILVYFKNNLLQHCQTSLFNME